MEIRVNNQQSISRTSGPGSSKKTEGKKGSKGSSSVESGSKVEGFDFFDELVDSLQRMPEEREAFLNRGNALLKQPDYPGDDHLKELERAIELESSETAFDERNKLS